MNISPLLAKKIVESMQQIIQQNINFIDKNGIIIASTDPKRIGTFHEAGKKVIDTNQVIIIDKSNEHLYKGSCPGINLPIELNDDVIATIGITGEASQVSTYSNIIRKMTEILILEEEFQSLRDRNRERYRMLLEDLIFYPHHFVERWSDAILSNWTQTDKKKIVIIKPLDSIFNFLKEGKNKIEQFIPSSNPDYEQNILYMEKEQMFVFLYKELETQKIKKIINTLLCISEKISAPILISYGSSTTSDFKNSYDNALLTIKSTKFEKNILKSKIIDYNDLTIELLIGTQNQEIKKIYRNRILGNLSEKELLEFKDIITCFEKHNGSITHIAEELFIHKNTLQYKIQKLKRLTGYDLRNYRDFMILRLAFATM